MNEAVGASVYQCFESSDILANLDCNSDSGNHLPCSITPSCRKALSTSSSGFALSNFVDASWEYSLTRKWVLALDATYRHQPNTRVTGHHILDTGEADPSSIQLNSGSSEAFGFAPAFEYSWKPNLGVLLGTRIIALGRNTPTTITPAVAINFVH